jgi:lipid-A-disaccharide synthase
MIVETAAAAVAAQPDVLVVIDSPDLTHRIARRVRAAAPTIPIVDYVCPSVWAWRSGRARAMRRYIDHVLALLPFEPEAMRRLGGPPCSYVGHPLIEQIHELRPNETEESRRHADPPVLLVLPGSRSGELRRLGPVFGAALARVSAQAGPLDVVVPTVPRLHDSVTALTAGWTPRPRVVSEREQARAAFRVARAALAKSGTVTLELALAGIPMVTAYKLSLFDEIVARSLIKVSSVILANLVVGENVVPEFIQRDCTAERLAAELIALLPDGPARQRQLDAFARLDAIMEIGMAEPAVRAADLVLATIRGGA